MALVEGIAFVQSDQEERSQQEQYQQKIVTKGVVNTSERNYSILERAERINGGKHSLARKRSMSRTRASSKQRSPMGEEVEKKDSGSKASGSGGSGSRPKLPPSNKQARPPKQTMMSLGGIAVVRERSRQAYNESRRARSKSKSKSTPESRGPRDSSMARGRGRSASRLRNVLKEVFRGRSNSTVRRSDSLAPQSRGRSVSRREVRESVEKSPPAPASDAIEQPSEETDGSAADASTKEEILPTEPEKPKNKIDSLRDHDVMKLDEKNNVLHVACLLHHTTADIVDRLEEDQSLAFKLNYADELPLHYAAMDKKGVNHEVLKKLLTINPGGVKQRNVQNSLPIHLACMVGAPSRTALKTFLKMYPKGIMVQSEFPLLFERDMIESVNEASVDVVVDDDDDFLAFSPGPTPKASGLASYFACGAPTQAELELVEESRVMKMKLAQQQEEEEEEEEEIDEGPQIETGFSPLHLAVMNSAHPSIIDLLIKVNEKCVHLKTSKGRTALACANYIVRQHWLYGTDDEGVVQNTFTTIEMLEKVVNHQGLSDA